MTERDRVTAIVLAGGRSARFGGPKLEASIGGLTVLDRALLAVDQVAASIVLAGPVPAALPPLDASFRAVPDEASFAGPLVALSGALRTGEPATEAATELGLVVGGDMPAIVPAVLGALLDRLGSDGTIDAAILEPAAGAKTPVLPLAIRVAPAIEAARVTIEAGDRSLVRFLGRLRLATVPADEWRPLDPAGRTLVDVDVPADLDRLRGNEIR